MSHELKYTTPLVVRDNSIKYFLVDMCGVIGNNPHDKAIPEYQKLFGKPYEELKEIVGRKYWRQYSAGLISEEEHWNGIINELGISSEYVTKMRQIILDSFEPNFQVINTFYKLKPTYHLILATNNAKEWRKVWQDRYFGDLFERTFDSSEIGIRKPDVKFFDLILESIQAKPEECKFFDDREDNIIAAISKGINSFLVTSNDALLEELKKIM